MKKFFTRKWIFFVPYIILGVALILLIFNTLSNRQHRQQVAGQATITIFQSNSLQANDWVLVDNYGNGIYYFNHRGKEFGKALSAFLSQHQKLEVISITGDVEELGRTYGYWVACKSKAK
jgi:hypothetical protein